MILKAGLTGGIASGKSTVARTFAGLGCLVIDADHVVRNLYRPGEPGHAAIVGLYGQEILTAEGEIDRQRLARLALSTEEGTRALNSLIHPLVAAETQRVIDEERARFPDRERIAIVEASLILEAGTRPHYDKVIVVDVSPEKQIERAVARGMTEQEVRLRMARQWSREQRLAHADYVIHNESDPRATERETLEVHGRLLADLKEKKLASSRRG